MKTKYKFIIDGIGVQFADVYRNKIETGVKYQKKQMIDFWKSKKESGYVLVFERDETGHFPMFPNKCYEISRNGESAELDIEEWKRRRL